MNARATAVLLFALPSTAAAAEQVITLDGVIEAGGLDHELVDFEVPAGTVEIEVRHADASDDDILDWGLYDPEGSRGWGGGNEEPAVVGIDAASRSYTPGPITPGTWRVVIGKAKIVGRSVAYELEVVLRDEATLAAQPERSAYQPSPALSDAPRWYAGDFHVHSRESGDARPPIDEIATFARSRGLDFVELSDHNVVSQADFIGAVQPDHPELLLLPGTEFTTYAGHANAIGATVWVDHKIGQRGVTIAGAFAELHEQGALVSINHPALDLGDLCIGCAWDHEIDPADIDAVEIATTGFDQAGRLFDDDAIEFWDELCDLGAHAAAIGGSDDHKAGVGTALFQSPIGDPTTMVFADELSAAALLDGIRASRTVVKLQGPADPMVELVAVREHAGDTVYADMPVDYTATASGADGLRLRVVQDGSTRETVDVAGDPFVHAFTIASPGTGETRVRIELLEGTDRRVVTSHVWQRRCDETACSDPAGGDTSGTATSAGTGETSSPGSEGSSGPAADAPNSSGCGCVAEPSASALPLALVLAARRRRRRG
jgi:uncharacterized protein (TIGR03382 family)